MKKLLTLVVLVAGVAVFAGCMNKPTTDDTLTTPTVETTTPVVEEVAPAIDATVATGTVETTTPEVAPIAPVAAPTPTAE